jgi:nucleotide-binding universal stress UspA family protein
MTAHSVLVLLTEPEGARDILDAAATAARALGEPRIDVLHVRLDPVSTILPSEEVLTPGHVRAVEGAAAVEGTKVYAEFEAWCAAGHAGQWQEVVGVPADEIRSRGPAAVLVAMTLPKPHPPSAQQAALEAALFDTDRPVLAVPTGWQGGFGRHLAVGWHDTPSTRKALTALRPWLEAAETITVLTVTDAPPPPPDGPLAGLPGRLTHRTLAHADDGDGDGAALLAAAMDAGADGLVMGAYRRGRLLEWLLGGVTEHVVHHAALPLLMVH